MNAEQRRQLAELAAGLPRVPPEKFKMNSWGQGYLDTSTETFNCGFAGCAIGWGPKLVKGWSLGLFKYSHYLDTIPYHNHMFEMEAVSRYFDIPLDDARHLFGGNSYPPEVSPVEVADRIAVYLETHP